MITPGTILIEEGTAVPEGLRLQHALYPGAWMSVRNSPDPYELEKRLSVAGWTFLYVSGALRTAAVGLNRQKAAHSALKRLIVSVRMHHCNCLEIDEVATRSFLGMAYVSVSAHPRRILKTADTTED